ncbi:MAG: TraC family protein [Patescibacteria group bacterium]
MNKLPPTQRYLDISEIRNDTVVLKDGTLRAVLLVSSINFGLKSEDEQKAVIAAYVQFLNTLEYPIQIVVQSRKLNIEPYLLNLRNRQREQTNELLKAQMADYIDFVKELVELGEIMSKKFFLVVPYNPMGDKKRGFLARISDVLSAGMIIRLKRERFEKYREQLFKRVENVISALSSMGLNAVPLDTQSLIELFYNIYNPVESETQKLVEMNKLRVEE